MVRVKGCFFSSSWLLPFLFLVVVQSLMVSLPRFFLLLPLLWFLAIFR
jgi:hypothetical protein